MGLMGIVALALDLENLATATPKTWLMVEQPVNSTTVHVLLGLVALSANRA